MFRWPFIFFSGVLLTSSLVFAGGGKKPPSEPTPELTLSPTPSPEPSPVSAADASVRNPRIFEGEEHKKWCDEIDRSVAEMKWKLPPCEFKGAKVGGYSVKKNPLVYKEYGDSGSNNTTLIFSTVHGDETTAFYIGYQLMNWLEQNVAKSPKAHVVLAPLVNPDGFFPLPVRKKTRVNAAGVDVNRNFLTKDWNKKALREWRRTYAANPRRFPGKTPDSEPETIFQRDLIEKYQPKKILSIHAPLNFMDYDGPNTLSLKRFPQDYVKTCLELQKRLKAVPGGFFPGSLGNYAGQERGIPTLTLELPSATPSSAEGYWNKFREGMKTVIEFEVPDHELSP